MELKNVIDPNTGQRIQIDADEVKNRQDKYLHISWVPFEWSKIDLSKIEVSYTVEWQEDVVELSLEELQAKYESEVGKLPARYKNDVEWIKSKL